LSYAVGYRISCPSVSLCLGVNIDGYAIVGVAKPESTIRRETQALLRDEITPTGMAQRIGALLRFGGARLSFTAPVAGSVLIRWFGSEATPGSARTHAGSVLVAIARRRFAAPVASSVGVRLTRAGIALLAHARRLRLTAHAIFTPSGKLPIAAVKTTVVRR
jgi:hypothetical protein